MVRSKGKGSEHFLAKRFYTLDGVRGVAALMVLLGHGEQWLVPVPPPVTPQAVDLFFVLSGFVIAKAYDRRFAAGMTGWQFMRQRYARLYPMYLVGLTIGFASALGALALGHGSMSGSVLALATISGLLMLPSPTWAATDKLTPLDQPAWSLVFELGANAVFAVLWHRLSSKVLLAIVAVSAVAMALLYSYSDGFAGPSWSHVMLGVPRVTFGFFAGVLIGRHYNPAPVVTQWAWSVPLAVVVAIYLIPGSEFAPYTNTGRVVDALFTIVGCPAIVIIGARLEPPRIAPMKVLGLISYPLYVIHVPIMGLFWRVLLAAHSSPAKVAPVGGIIFVVATVGIAWALSEADDRMRQTLKQRRRQRAALSDPIPSFLS